jgi:hypothetical protein
MKKGANALYIGVLSPCHPLFDFFLSARTRKGRFAQNLSNKPQDGSKKAASG